MSSNYDMCYLPYPLPEVCYEAPDRTKYFESGKLWTLWDMLRAYAYQFAGLSKIIEELRQIAPPPPPLPPPPTTGLGGSLLAAYLAGETDAPPKEPGSITRSLMGLGTTMPRNELDERTRIVIPALRVFVEWVSLPSTAPQVDRIEAMLKRTHSRDELLNALSNLLERLEDDLKRLMFFHVRSEDVSFYNDADLMGAAVADRFKSVADDIEAAGKCMAFRQGTATVFHLMRVLEAGLKELGRMLGIPYAPSWDGYINQITTKVAAKRKTKGIAWRRDEPFFIEIVGDIVAIKYAWRNPTMHVVRKYSPDEAEEIFRCSKRFMNRLAEKMSAKK